MAYTGHAGRIDVIAMIKVSVKRGASITSERRWQELRITSNEAGISISFEDQQTIDNVIQQLRYLRDALEPVA